MTDKDKVKALRRIILEGFNEFVSHFQEDRSYTQQEINDAVQHWFLEYVVQANAIGGISEETLNSFTNYIIDKMKKNDGETSNPEN